MPWKKGQSGNPKGRVKKPEIEELRKAIKAVEQKKGKKLLQHFVERAFKQDSVLIAIIKKLIADKTQLDGTLDGRLEIEPLIIKVSKNADRDKAT